MDTLHRGPEGEAKFSQRDDDGREPLFGDRKDDEQDDRQPLFGEREGDEDNHRSGDRESLSERDDDDDREPLFGEYKEEPKGVEADEPDDRQPLFGEREDRDEPRTVETVTPAPEVTPDPDVTEPAENQHEEDHNPDVKATDPTEAGGAVEPVAAVEHYDPKHGTEDDDRPPLSRFETWRALSHVDYAMKTSRRGMRGLIGALRPAGSRSPLGWHREPTLNPAGLLTLDQIKALGASYAAHDKSKALEVWYSRAAAELELEFRETTGITDADRTKLHRYYREAAFHLLRSGALTDPDTMTELEERLGRYDVMAEDQAELEAHLEDLTKNAGSRFLMLGASAVRGTYRALTLPFGALPAFVYTRVGEHQHGLTPLEVQNARRVKAVTVGAVALGAAAFFTYQAAKSGGDPKAAVDGFVPPMPTPTGEVPVPVDVPPIQTPPVEVPPVPPIEFSEAAQTLSSGEGLLQTIDEAVPGLNAAQQAAVAREVGPLLLTLTNAAGEAVAYKDANLGLGGVGLNEGDGATSQAALELIRSTADRLFSFGRG